VRGQSRHENARYIYSMADKEHALEFQLLFDGELIKPQKDCQ